MGPSMVASSIMAGFIGGTCTIGTAQMAYQYGIAALWFVIGGSFGCLIQALILARPLREKKVDTVSQFLAVAYGKRIRPWVAVYLALGLFIQVAVQTLAAVPLLTAMVPLSPVTAAALFTLLTLIFIIGGGFWSTGLVGFFKLALLSMSLLVAGVISWSLLGGGAGVQRHFTAFPWLSMFPRGVLPELAGGLATVVGFISTQSYLQPLFAARDVKAARNGALLSAVFIPLVGLAAASVGMYMRFTAPGIDAASALPQFMFKYLNPYLGGLGVATLLISLILSGASLLLGMSTVLCRDLYNLFRPEAPDREVLLASRIIVLVFSALSFVFVLGILGDMILEWTYLSNALRGVTVFAPLMAAIFFSRRISPGAGRLAVAIAPLLTVLWALFFPGRIHPLYIGLPLSVFILLAGLLYNKKQETGETSGNTGVSRQ